MQIAIPQVTREDCANFGKVWRFNGLFVGLDDVHIQFATDYANIALMSFIRSCQEQVMQAVQQAPIIEGEQVAKSDTSLIEEE